MNPFLSLFPPGPILADGAWGTEFRRLGLPAGVPSDPWNLARPDAVRAVARSYVEAGSQLLLTNTFQASLPTLKRLGQANDWRAINSQGVALCRSESGPGLRVFGSIGPCGLSADDRMTSLAAYRDQALLLRDSGVDGLVLETFFDPSDARLAAEGCHEARLPLILSFVIGFGPDGDRTPSGATIDAVVWAVNESGADAVGLNCGQSLSGAIRLLPEIRARTNLPVWFKPTAGYPTPVGPEEFAELILGQAAPLPDALGGCCGTGPSHIARLAKSIKEATA